MLFRSVRSASRMTGVSKGTVLRLLVSVGAACDEYQNRVIRNVAAKRVQVDEIWSFVGCKQKNVTAEKMATGHCGDVWTFTAIEAQSKLVISWMVGARDAGCATELLRDVEGRLSNRIQLTTDGHKMYLVAVPDAFAESVDYAQLVKVMATIPRDRPVTARRNVLEPSAWTSSAPRTKSTSAPLMWNGRISTCG